MATRRIWRIQQGIINVFMILSDSISESGLFDVFSVTHLILNNKRSQINIFIALNKMCDNLLFLHESSARYLQTGPTTIVIIMVEVASNTNQSTAIVAVEARTDLGPNSIQEVASTHNSAKNMESLAKTDSTACSIGQVQQLLAMVASIKLEGAFVDTITTVASFVAGHTVVEEPTILAFVGSLTQVDILHIVTGVASFMLVAFFYLDFEFLFN